MLEKWEYFDQNEINLKKRKNMRNFIIVIFIAIFLYAIIGTSTRIPEIKERAPSSISDRGWKILRYEGYQLGSFWNHGGKVWYHVQDVKNKNIQYRVRITLWNNELHYRYGAPEKLSRIQINGVEDIPFVE